MIADPKTPAADSLPESPTQEHEQAKEIGGGKGPDPTRYGDWEIGGKCVDF